jgi:hypothetical protein
MAYARADQHIASVLSWVESVDCVYVRDSGDMLRVFTVVEDEDEATLDAIYDRERTLIREIPGRRFDFNVIARRGRDIANILGDASPVWQRFQQRQMRSKHFGCTAHEQGAQDTFGVAAPFADGRHWALKERAIPVAHARGWTSCARRASKYRDCAREGQ